MLLVVGILTAMICSLLAAWVTMRLLRRHHDHAAVIAFVVQFVLAIATAWIVGAGFDFVGVPMYAPRPKPGNFTLPIPWMFFLPILQAVTFGPISGVIAGKWASLNSTKADDLTRGDGRHD